MHRAAMDHGMHFDLPCFEPHPHLRRQSCVVNSSKGCGQRNYKRSLMLLFAADPDERRARGTHSLAEDGHRLAVADGPDLLELIGHAPRRSNPDSSTLLAARGEENRIKTSLFRICCVWYRARMLRPVA